MEFTAIVASAHLPMRDPIDLGVLVLDEATDRLYFRFRTDVDEMADPDDIEVIRGIPGMIESMATEMGALGLLKFLEDCCSNAIRLGERFTVQAENAVEALNREFAKIVAE